MLELTAPVANLNRPIVVLGNNRRLADRAAAVAASPFIRSEFMIPSAVSPSPVIISFVPLNQSTTPLIKSNTFTIESGFMTKYANAPAANGPRILLKNPLSPLKASLNLVLGFSSLLSFTGVTLAASLSFSFCLNSKPVTISLNDLVSFLSASKDFFSITKFFSKTSLMERREVLVISCLLIN